MFIFGIATIVGSVGGHVGVSCMCDGAATCEMVLATCEMLSVACGGGSWVILVSAECVSGCIGVDCMHCLVAAACIVMLATCVVMSAARVVMSAACVIVSAMCVEML